MGGSQPGRGQPGWRRTRCAAVCAALVLAVAGLTPPAGAGSAVPAVPIPEWWGRGLVPGYVGAPASPRPVPGRPVAHNPHMSPAAAPTMHADSYSSDAHASPGPLGVSPVVRSTARAAIGGECAGVAFDAAGRVVTVCGTLQKFELLLLDPVTLAQLAAHDLPPRPSTLEAILTGDLQKIFTDTSGGAYFFLDAAGRVVLADARQHLVRIAVEDGPGGPGFRVVDDWDLGSRLAPRDCWSPQNPTPAGECDAVTAVMPDWEGRIWWVSRLGRVGTLDPATGGTRAVRLAGEEIQNSFSVAEDGVYVVSDHAIYRFAAGPGGTPRVGWRETYDRGTGAKPGSVNQGSGTTPTLLGGQYVAITDNADDRMHVLVYRRRQAWAGDRLVCAVAVFGSGASTTDNSLIGYGRSLVVENNYGYRNFTSVWFGGSTPGGLARIDVEPGGAGCRVVWESAARSSSVVAKLSVATGLVYCYTKEPQALWIDAWYLAAIDFRTGRTVYRVLTGTGPGYDNQWAPITLGPDGAAYVGVFNGLVAVRDT